MGLEVLLIGATGHIGGAVLVALVRAYPDLNITALVRAENDLSGLPARVKTVVGSLEDSHKLRQLAQQATIVINCAPDITHGIEIRSILQDLAESKCAPHRYYIHTTGAALIWDSMTGKVDGSRVWDDVADIELIQKLEDSRTHARTDRIVREANTDTVHTALVSPVFVLGVNPGGKRPTPLIWPNLLHVMRQLGCGWTVQNGSNVTSFVEVNALARLYAALVGNALSRLGSPVAGATWVGKGKSTEAGIPVWGPEAYYFASSIAVPWRELMRDRILPALRRHGATFLRSNEVRELPNDTLRDIIMSRYEATVEDELWATHIAEGFGVNMRVRSSRAEKALGISLHDEDGGLEETIRALMADEAQ